MCTVSMVQCLVKHGAKLHDTRALMGASVNNIKSQERIEIMNYLLDVGVDVNNVEVAGDDPEHDSVFKGTALHRAVEMEDEERDLLLLRRGADPRIRGPQGLIPLEVAELRRLHYMAEILREHGEP